MSQCPSMSQYICIETCKTFSGISKTHRDGLGLGQAEVGTAGASFNEGGSMSTDPKVRPEILAEIQAILDKSPNPKGDDLLCDAIRIALLQHDISGLMFAICFTAGAEL